MPGPAFHFEVLDLAAKQLAGGGAADAAKAKVLTDHREYAHLGALGPDILRYMPVDTKAIDTLTQKDVKALTPAELKALALQVQPSPVMSLYGVLFRLLVPLLPSFVEIDALLEEMAGIAAAEDVDRLKNAKAKFDALKPKIDGLKDLSAAGQASLAAGLAALFLGKPVIQTDLPSLPGTSEFWRPFELLRWKRTGTFARNLLKEAKAQGDPQLLAYAYGYLIHTAASITAEPFVNTIAGGPYRTHWWRNQFVRNHIDPWIFGRYETPAKMAGDEPTPPYADWKDLCGANLQTRCTVDPGLTGPNAAKAVESGAPLAPAGFDKVAALLLAAAQATFNAAPAVSMPPELQDKETFRRAYLGVIAVLWFMTGGAPLCADPPGTPPNGAETPPPWFGSGGGSPPPAPSTGGGGGSSGSSTASGIIAAILGVISLVTGNVPLGVVAIILAIAAAASGGGGSVNWDGLRGTIYWLQVSMFQIKDGIHKGLIAGGLGYPHARHLGTQPGGLFGTGTRPISDDSQSPVPLTKSRHDETYPRRMYETVVGGKTLPPDVSFRVFPLSPVEEASTDTLLGAGLYPDAVVDGVGLLNGGVISDDGSKPTRRALFGGAVANAAAVVSSDAATLPNYNLDGDRGYGWKTWRPKLGTKPADPVPVVPEFEP